MNGEYVKPINLFDTTACNTFTTIGNSGRKVALSHVMVMLGNRKTQPFRFEIRL